MRLLVARLLFCQILCHSVLAFVPSCTTSRVPIVNYVTPTTTSEDEAIVETTNENPRLSGLSFMLDDGTRKSHSMAENTAFVTGFFKGLANRESYKALMTSLYFVYTAMEEAMDETSSEEVKALDDPALRRLTSLERDMAFFYGGNEEWTTSIAKIKPSPATKVYVARIQEIAANQPYLLVAHQYTRYLGDLFGGQMMGGMASKSLDLGDDGDGVAFYTFDDIPSTNKFITEWYQKLNQLDLTDKQKQEIVEEANYVFSLNIGILEELDGPWLSTVWTLAINSLKSKLFGTEA